jgi:hypothetical protein
VCNANLQSTLETLMDNQEALEAKLMKRKKTSHKKPKKAHYYYDVACGWHLGVFKVPTGLEDQQKATLGFPKGKLSSKKFSMRKAAARWFVEELAGSDDSHSEEEDSVSSVEESSRPSRSRGHKGESSPESSNKSSSEEDKEE